MRWQILKRVGGEFEAQPDLFDDGIWGQPGEPQFTTEHVVAHIAALGDDYSYSWVGMSVVVNPAMEGDIASAVTLELARIAASQLIPDGTNVDGHLQSVADQHGDAVRAAVLRDMGVAATP